MPYYRQRLRVLIVGALTVAAACSASHTRNATSTVSGQSAIRLSVNNEFGFPVTVQAVGSGASWRLGTVMPASIREFTVPNALTSSGPVEFIVSGHGSAPVRSGPLQLAAGRVVDFHVTRPLYASTAILRR